MAKDPAFLFYPSDFLTGTMFMTDEQVGKYIRLLCAQHQKGHLCEKDMMMICKTYDEDIFDKFVKDEEGKYFNERLEKEKAKRTAYSESRRRNRKKKEEDMLNTSETYDKHMENENINGNNRDRESAERERESKKPNQKQVDELFEKVWSFYPVKKGKASVSAKQKRVLYEIGYDELKRCFDRYVSSKEKWKEYQQGSTFFNSGYVDYLDINYGQPSFQQPTIEVNSGPQVPNYRSED